MHIEIHKPELEQRVRRQIQSGQYNDVDELLTKALDALEDKAPTPASGAVRRTGAALLEVLEASPYPEIDLTPPRVPIIVRDVRL